MNRRNLLRTTFLALPMLAVLSACGTTTVAQIAAQITADVDLVAQSLDAQLPALQAALGVNAAAVGAVATEVEQIVAAAAAFAVATSQATGAPIVTQIASDFSALETALAGFTLPATLQKIITAVSVLLPIIEVGVGLLATPSAAANTMTAAQARAVLLAAR
jgi:hypothetical protein